MTAYVNARTSIVRACLPWYNPDDPKQHTKHTRESILKLMAGMNNDTQPLAFRSKHIDDGSLDRYFPGAPGWTNLTRGKRPRLSCTPYNTVKMLIDACKCVPFVKDVPIYIVEDDDAKMVTLEELEALNLQIQPVPLLYLDAPPTSTSSSSSGESLQASRDEAARKEVAKLEEQVKVQAEQNEELMDKVNQLMLELNNFKKSQACLTLDIHLHQ